MGVREPTPRAPHSGGRRRISSVSRNRRGWGWGKGKGRQRGGAGWRRRGGGRTRHAEEVRLREALTEIDTAEGKEGKEGGEVGGELNKSSLL